MASSEILVKVSVGTDTRRFEIGPEISFEALRQKIFKVFQLENSFFLIKYRDTDNDLLTITNDEELANIVKHDVNATNRILRLLIFTESCFSEAGIHFQSMSQENVTPNQQETPEVDWKTLLANREKFSADLNDGELLTILKDIRQYISSIETTNPSIQQRVTVEKNLITPTSPEVPSIVERHSNAHFVRPGEAYNYSRTADS